MMKQHYVVKITMDSKRESTFMDQITVEKHVHAISAEEAVEDMTNHLYGNYVDLNMSNVETVKIECELKR